MIFSQKVVLAYVNLHIQDYLIRDPGRLYHLKNVWSLKIPKMLGFCEEKSEYTVGIHHYNHHFHETKLTDSHLIGFRLAKKKSESGAAILVSHMETPPCFSPVNKLKFLGDFHLFRPRDQR